MSFSPQKVGLIGSQQIALIGTPPTSALAPVHILTPAKDFCSAQTSDVGMRQLFPI